MDNATIKRKEKMPVGLRDERLNAHWFRTLNEVRGTFDPLAPRVQLRTSAQFARLQNAGRVPAKYRSLANGIQ
jgi:hypothetical protein